MADECFAVLINTRMFVMKADTTVRSAIELMMWFA